MAYNLPPAWDPGFVLPKNVQDEGIERRAFITKWMPRGTYDQPTVGTGGYQVPKYVLDEGYGQGTFTTKWQPSGSYAGPRVPNWLNRRPQVVRTKRMPGGGKVVTVQPLNGDDDAIPGAYQDYGAKAAQVIVSQVSRLPAAQRPAAMRAMLAKIDKSLWDRTNQIWQRYVAQGIAPSKAFPLALARAIAAGFSAEVYDMGLRRRAPQVNSLLGLGCYPLCGVPSGLGVLTQEDIDAGAEAPDYVPHAPVPPPPQPPLDDGVIDASDVMFVGDFPFRSDVPVKVWAAGTGDTVNNRAKPALFEVERPDDLTAGQIGFLKKYLTEEVDGNGQRDDMIRYTASDSMLGGTLPPDGASWFTKIGIGPDTPVRKRSLWALRTAARPVAWTTHPRTKEDLALHVYLDPRDPSRGWAADNPLVIKAWISTFPKSSWWVDALKTIVKLPFTLDPTGSWGVVQDVAGDVTQVAIDIHDAIRDAIHKLTCEVLNSKEGEAAGAAVASYYGAPPDVGVAGVKSAASLCPSQAPPPAPPPVVPVKRPSVLPVALLAGGGVLAALILLGKRKRKAT